MNSTSTSYSSLVANIWKLDGAYIGDYNERMRLRSQYRLHTNMGPCPYEGNVDSAPVVLLLANPGYDATSSEHDHFFRLDGWPLAGLHPDAPVGMRTWWQPRLRHLIEKHTLQGVSRSVAALQLNPWASERFDPRCRPPSQQLLFTIAQQALMRGAIVVRMRCAKIWSTPLQIVGDERVISTKNPRASYLSPGNLGIDRWAMIDDAVTRYLRP